VGGTWGGGTPRGSWEGKKSCWTPKKQKGVGKDTKRTNNSPPRNGKSAKRWSKKNRAGALSQRAKGSYHGKKNVKTQRREWWGPKHARNGGGGGVLCGPKR